MMSTIFKMMFTSGLRDGYLLFWSILFPIGLMIGLGTYFDTPSYQERIMIGVLAMSVIFGALNTTAIIVLQQRNRGVYKLLKTTPLPTISFVVIMTAARTLISVIVSTLILLTGLLYFDIDASILEIIMILFALAIGTLGFTALSFFVANLAQNEAQTNAISNLISLPLLFASEAFYSLANAPNWVKMIRDISPFNYLLKAMHNSLLEGWNKVWLSILFLVGFTAISITLAILTYRWDSEVSFWSRFKKNHTIDLAH
jgi:ABC-2 type transport system permease protein